MFRTGMRFALVSFLSIAPAWLVAQVPAIVAVSPGSGVVGDTVTINGTNFDPTAASNLVRFGAVAAAVVNATTDTLTVQVPAGASYSRVSVQLLNGRAAWSPQPFRPIFSPAGTLTSSSFFVSTGFQPHAQITLATGVASPTQGVLVADFDQDGRPDVAVANWNPASTVLVYRNQHVSGVLAAASFAAPLAFTVANNPIELAAGDL